MVCVARQPNISTTNYEDADPAIDTPSTMYFDGQLHYLDKENKAAPKQQLRHTQPSQVPTSHARAHTADPSTSPAPPPPPPPTPPAPHAAQASAQHKTSSPSLFSSSVSTMPNALPPKSQTVAGTAGDLHSMALKSAINNIGTSCFLCHIWV